MHRQPIREIKSMQNVKNMNLENKSTRKFLPLRYFFEEVELSCTKMCRCQVFILNQHEDISINWIAFSLKKTKKEDRRKQRPQKQAKSNKRKTKFFLAIQNNTRSSFAATGTFGKWIQLEFRISSLGWSKASHARIWKMKNMAPIFLC